MVFPVSLAISRDSPVLRQVAGLGRATVQGPHPDLRPTKMGLVDELKESWEINGNLKMMVDIG